MRWIAAVIIVLVAAHLHACSSDEPKRSKFTCDPPPGPSCECYDGDVLCAPKCDLSAACDPGFLGGRCSDAVDACSCTCTGGKWGKCVTVNNVPCTPM
jgi:hypothetical protein